MLLRTFAILSVLGLAVRGAVADEVLYRYEGDVVPYDESPGWINGNPCEAPCTESVENGRLVLRWSRPGETVGYHLWIPEAPEAPAPPTLWVEWRFRSNCPVGPFGFGSDARFVVQYGAMHELVWIYGDVAISFGGNQYVAGLDIEQFHTFRFESLDGINYRISADGQVFIIDAEDNPGASFLQLAGDGACELLPEPVNEWDFVRYGTISYGEQIIASDPPAGPVELAVGSTLDRFTVTFDSPNYVYIDEITVETTGADPPQVIQTRRRENDEPHTVEIVLDRPMPLGRTTRFTFDDGVAVNVVEYTVTELIPAVSQWGLAILALLVLTVGTIMIRTRASTGTSTAIASRL
jgi:hypothetical protein